MERSLLLSALALGCVGYACAAALLHAGRKASGKKYAVSGGSDRAYVFTTVGLALLVFLATLPSKPPFATGHGLGLGFVVGSLGALLAYVIAARAMASETGQPLLGAALSAGPLSAGLVAITLPQLVLHDTALDALLGVAVGWFAGTLILLTGFIGRRSSDESAIAPHVHGSAVLTLVTSLGFVATLAGIAALGIYRDTAEFQSDRWSAAGTVLGAGIPFTIFICSLSAPLLARVGLKTPFPRLFGSVTQRLFTSEDGRQAASRIWRIVLASGLLLVLAWLLSNRVLNHPRLLHITAIGLTAGWICWWLLAEGQGNSADRSRPVYFVPLAAVTILAAVIVSFNLMAAFGVGCMIIAGWLAVGMAQSIVHESAAQGTGTTATVPLQSLIQLMFFGTAVVLYRLVTTRFSDDVRGVNLTEYYALMAFLLASALPTMLASLLSSTDQSTAKSPARQITRLAICGALMLAFPAIALILWKAKVALALTIGLALATIVPLWNKRSDSGDSNAIDYTTLLPAVIALGMVLALSQWTHHVLTFATLSRDAKIGLLKWIIGGLIAFIFAADFGGRLFGKHGSNSAPLPDAGGIKG